MAGVDAEDTLGGDSPVPRFPVEPEALAAFPRALSPVARGWLAGPVLPSLMARRAAKCFSTSIFLIRIIAAPAALSESSAAFAGSAEDDGVELLEASSRCVGWNSNCVA